MKTQIASIIIMIAVAVVALVFIIKKSKNVQSQLAQVACYCLVVAIVTSVTLSCYGLYTYKTPVVKAEKAEKHLYFDNQGKAEVFFVQKYNEMIALKIEYLLIANTGERVSEEDIEKAKAEFKEEFTKLCNRIYVDNCPSLYKQTKYIETGVDQKNHYSSGAGMYEQYIDSPHSKMNQAFAKVLSVDENYQLSIHTKGEK